MTLKNKAFNDIITFTRASGGGRFNASGVYEFLGNNVPRLDYDPVTLQSKGLLIEEQRTNLLTYSSDFSGAAWNKSSATIATGASIGPDGLASAALLVASAGYSYASSSATVLSQFITVTGGVAHTWSIFAKAAGVTRIGFRNNWTGAITTFDLTDGQPAPGKEYVGNDWYRCSVTYTPSSTSTNGISVRPFVSGGTADGTSGIYIWGAQLEAGAFPTSYIPTPATFTSRASTATYFNSSGVLTTAAINEARYDHRFIGGQWVPTGLVLETAATNLLESSNGFSSSYWTYSDATLVANSAIAPDGTLTAGKLTESFTGTGNPPHRVTNATDITAGVQYVASVYVKSAGNSRRLELRNYNGLNADSITIVDVELGTVISGPGRVEPVGNGWFRVWHTVTAQASVTSQFAYQIYLNNGTSAYVGDGTSGIYIWGAQFEVGSQPTSYIPTGASQVTRAADVSSSAQVTRSADVASVNTLSPWYNASEGTLLVEASSNMSGGTIVGYYFSLQKDTTNSDQLVAYFSPANLQNGYFYMISGSTVIDARIQTQVAVGEVTRSAIAYSDSAVFATKGLASSSVPLPGRVPAERLTIGNRGSGSRALNGHIRNISYYPRRLTDGQLQSLTTP